MNTQPPSKTSPAPGILTRDDHPLSRKMISESALKVLYRLNRAGFEAYLVGGCVRDSLLGKTPKDFDVATSATPEQVNDLFRNARIIGRRFRIVHVRFGREIIEVTTFRGQHDTDSDTPHAQQSDDGLLLRDNVWGSVDQDALRRDFTINALYYNIDDFSIHDWADGLSDLENGYIRLIGDPETRYREDPVRMLRAVRFAAKLGFDIEPATRAPIQEMAPLLLQIPSARLFEEVLKLFLSGYARATYDLLCELNLFPMLFPATSESTEEFDWATPLIRQALANTDQRIHADKPVTPAFLYGALLWPAVQLEMQQIDNDTAEMPAFQQASHNVIQRQLKHTSIPKRFSFPMRDIWELQFKLPKRRGKRAFQNREHPRFRAAYDFLLLREEAGEIESGLGQWWTDFQTATPDQQRTMVEDVSGGEAPSSTPGSKRKPRRRKRKPASS
ncbi:polynucleotide adenylyltransferase PcnB [Larsenimonas salina]|uniref:polynucleotide adenylyltransferase PcnB n=1 Tax=Larsenimonas salina TaxID=1295565 RepID=UPI002073FB10|nr:polynucleotide adenylyltransferase PcnB [Larsenimonas salina]MCM5705313.1 polynucleotide adenylyltransferase PcnB [Larsenimonas salina]